MATPMDLLKAPDFADDRLTETINIPPYRTGRPAQLGLFRDVPIPTTYVRLGIDDGELTIIPARERGGESNLSMRSDKKGTEFQVPHFPLDDTITPSDLQNLVQWGDHQFMALVQSVNDRLEALRGKHDLTHSYLDWGAIKGLVVDSEGKVLIDLFETFEITQSEVNFDLNDETFDVAAKNRAARALLRRELRGQQATGFRVFAGPTFYDKYVGHASVLEALKAYRGDTPNPQRDEVDEEFSYAGLRLERIEEEYPVRNADGTVTRKKVVFRHAKLTPLWG